MHDPGRYRFTLAQGMIVTAALALLMAIPYLANRENFEVVGFTLGSLALLCWIQIVVGQTLGRGCPNCGRRGLKRLAVGRRDFRYYHCRLCGAHWKRRGFGPLIDDTVAARKRREAERLRPDAITAEVDASTTGRLLGAKLAGPPAPSGPPSGLSGQLLGKPAAKPEPIDDGSTMQERLLRRKRRMGLSPSEGDTAGPSAPDPTSRHDR